MRAALVSLGLLALPGALAGQLDAAPSGLAALETARSRSCVGTLAEIATVNRALEPLLKRGQRLQLLAQAIAVEDQSLVQPFDARDQTESMVRDWFGTDGALAQRYVAVQSADVLAERNAGRETIKAVVTNAIQGVQAEANSIMEANQELIARAGPCDGAIFVRGAVLEACATGTGPICEQAALPPTEVEGFRFVEIPEDMWDIRELRPWSTPSPVRFGAAGQLDGGRTIGYARFGNVVVSLAFTPLLRDQTAVTPEQLAAFQAVNDSLGLTFDSPTLAFTPALGVRAALPQPLASERGYIVHFGDATAPDVVWSGEAGTGRSLEATRPLTTQHVRKLQAGQTLSLTALGGASGDEPAFSITLSNVNQSQAALVLLNYMSGQLATDLARLLQPRG